MVSLPESPQNSKQTPNLVGCKKYVIFGRNNCSLAVSSKNIIKVLFNILFFLPFVDF